MFEAVLERGAGHLGWTVVRIPFDAAKLWGKRGQIRVKGEINGFEFRATLFPDGHGNHSLLVRKQMQRGAGVVVGSKARFRMEPDIEERRATVPAEWTKVMSSSKRLKKFSESFSPSMTRYLHRLVGEPKSAAARMRRAEQFAVQMMETMDAEEQLPPLVERALTQERDARRGWEMMTPRMRRQELMGIFYYRQPASRAKRLAKAVAMAKAYAEKRSSG